MFRSALLLVAFGVLIAPALAQEVTYQREVTFSGTVNPVLATVYAPVNPADVSDPGSHWLTAAGNTAEYYLFSSTAATSARQTLNGILLDPSTSRVAMTGFGTPSAKAYFFTALNQIITYNLISRQIEAQSFVDSVVEGTSLAVSPTADHTTIIGTGNDGSHGGFEINLQTGAATKVFSTEGDSAFSTTTFYQSYGADGLLYVLDYGNDRVVALDPNDSYSEKHAFTLTSAVANMQFAMDDNNDLFLGDGAGGGSMYSATGTLLNTFLLPDGSYSNPFANGIDPYVDYTPDGHAFVFDNTGAHQYEVVPEPATWALMVGGLAGLGALARKRD